MSAPVISILIPTCNRAELLNDAITSAIEAASGMRGQVEILVSDNASNDGGKTAEVIRNYGAFIKPFHHTVKLSMAVHWNFLMSKARGVYIKLLSDDDLLLPDSLVSEMHELDQNARLGLVSTAWVEGDPKYKQFKKDPASWGGVIKCHSVKQVIYLPNEALREMIFKENIFGNPSAVLFRKCAMGPFPDSWEYAVDWAGWIKILVGNWAAKILPTPGCVVRVHNSNATHELRRKNKDLKEVMQLRLAAWAYSDAGFLTRLYLFGVHKYRWARRMAKIIYKRVQAA